MGLEVNWGSNFSSQVGRYQGVLVWWRLSFSNSPTADNTRATAIVLHRMFAAALAFAQVSAAANVTWAPCFIQATPVPGYGDEGKVAECAIYKAPLCHPGICETPDSASSTIGGFVKRLRATIGAETAPNVWLIQGGPYYTPGAFDNPIMKLYLQLNGRANVYIMDHRGTGQSTHLTGKELQVAATDPSNGGEMNPSQVPGCAEELEDKYGDLASFSTTSAATDLATFISDYENDFSTTVYGVGYGTIWAERVMHLGPPKVTGYVLDGVLTTSGANLDNFMYMSSLTAGFGEVSDDFLELCDEDKACSARFKKKVLKLTLQHLEAELDKHPSSKCAKGSSRHSFTE